MLRNKSVLRGTKFARLFIRPDLYPSHWRKEIEQEKQKGREEKKEERSTGPGKRAKERKTSIPQWPEDGDPCPHLPTAGEGGKGDGKRARGQSRGGEEVCKIELVHGEVKEDRLEEKRVMKGSKVGSQQEELGENGER